MLKNSNEQIFFTDEEFFRKKNSGWAYPDPRTKDPSEHFRQRVFEVIPGIMTWTTLLGIFFASWLFPIGAALFIIVFDIYWLYRTFYFSFFSMAARRKMKIWEQINWLDLLKAISQRNFLKKINQEIVHLKEKIKKTKMFSSERKELKKILRLKNYILKMVKKDYTNQKFFLDWRKIYHVLLLPTAVEEAESILPALEAAYQSNYPKDKIIILLAMEEREPEERRKKKERILREKYGDKFFDFLVTVHQVKDNEMKCKASNATYAVKELVKYLEKKNISWDNVILSNLDCETRIHREFLPALSYAFVTEPDRYRRAYQPLPIYNNNIWDTIMVVRLLATGSAFWHMIKSMQPENMVTFSSHSEPLKTIVALDYWPVNVISEDSVIYWKGYDYFDGHYQVKPIYLPVSMDAVLAESYWKTLQNQYKQKRRWAYGIENFPLFGRAALNNSKISFWKKWKRLVVMLEGHYSWATTSFILLLLGWLPLFLGGERFNETVLAHNLPIITRVLMSLAMIGLLFSMALSFSMLPPKPKKYSRGKYVMMFVQWLFVPLLGVFFGLPAVDSQTRLLLGKYFGEFWVTEKLVKKEN